MARRVMSQGIFKGAVVMRGADWRWEDQDGKMYVASPPGSPYSSHNFEPLNEKQKERLFIRGCYVQEKESLE